MRSLRRRQSQEIGSSVIVMFSMSQHKNFHPSEALLATTAHARRTSQTPHQSNHACRRPPSRCIPKKQQHRSALFSGDMTQSGCGHLLRHGRHGPSTRRRPAVSAQGRRARVGGSLLRPPRPAAGRLNARGLCTRPALPGSAAGVAAAAAAVAAAAAASRRRRRRRRSRRRKNFPAGPDARPPAASGKSESSAAAAAGRRSTASSASESVAASPTLPPPTSPPPAWPLVRVDTAAASELLFCGLGGMLVEFEAPNRRCPRV